MSISRGYRIEPNYGRISKPLHEGYDGNAAEGAADDRDRQVTRSDEATLDWLAAARRVALDVDLDASAHSLGAMLRRRGVPTATNLLCLALMHGPGRMPLRMITERADAHGIAKVSEPALLRRLSNASAWLEHVVHEILMQRLADQQGDLASHDTVATSSPICLAAGSRPAMMPMSSRMLVPRAQSLQERLALQSSAARSFIVHFSPWPADLFSDSQIHWLLCVRWNFVSANLRDQSPGRHDIEAPEGSSLDRCRLNACLLAALISADPA